MSNTIFPNKTGFTKIDNELFYVQSVVSASAFSLLVRIYRATQGYGVAVKALSGVYLQKTTNLSKNTVTKATKELEAIGVLLVKRRARVASYYQVSVNGVLKVCKQVKDSLLDDEDSLALNLEQEALSNDVIEKEVIATPDRGFDDFWMLFDKNVGKIPARALWCKLRDKEREQALSHVKGYVESSPDKQYRKDPANYLRDKVWLDEILPPVQHNTPAPVNNYQQPPSFSAPVEVTREVIQEGSEADEKVQAFLRSFGKKGGTYA